MHDKHQTYPAHKNTVPYNQKWGNVKYAEQYVPL